MRLEAAKANSAAVVRQQVFYFDPNYRDPANVVGADGLSLMPAQPQYGPNTAGGLLAAGGGGGGGGGGGSYYDPNGSIDDAGSVGTTSRQQYGNTNHSSVSGAGSGAGGIGPGGMGAMRSSSFMGIGASGASGLTAGSLAQMHGGGGGGGIGVGGVGVGVGVGGLKNRAAVAMPNPRYSNVAGNMNASLQAATAAYHSGTSNHSQEELLKQLFPSWF
jgi:hypothetical protein